ncbi:unnamed protein product [Cuscuta campestris]|uniref:DUF4283 domain-containing protein n=1 Tax=Cuscuta campestris TaxID=132261 RepID=A0A484LIP8_9ASTE|nr:unnamed protein product [Cuscuta campestris]
MTTTLPQPPKNRSFYDIALKGDFKPATKFNNLCAMFVRTIVGRFTKGRPCLISIRKAFERIAFEKNFTVSFLDETHILINFESENDFLRCLLRKYWKINGFVLKVFRWTHDFDPAIDSPLIPVWISLEGLPIHLFDSLALYSIANLIGKPLKTDAATASLSRPSVARICVEVDTSKDLPNGVWIHLGQLTFHQPIIYEDLPEYCPSCKSFGHKNCKKATTSRWVVKDTTGSGNIAPAVAVPPLLLQANLQLVDKQDDALNHDGPKEEETTIMETCSSAQAETHLVQSVQVETHLEQSVQVETHLVQSVPKSDVNGLEQILVHAAETTESENEEQSAIDTVTHKASVEALATTIDNGRDAEAPAPTDSAENKGVLVEIEQLQVIEDAFQNNKNPPNNDPNFGTEQSSMGRSSHRWVSGPLAKPISRTMPNSDGKFYPSLFKPWCKITTRQNDLAQRWEAYPIDGNPAMGSLFPLVVRRKGIFLRVEVLECGISEQGYDSTTIGPILESFEVDGEHYEIRSYVEEAETSNQREEPNFQDVQSRRSKKAGKRGTAPRTIKTRSYDPNLEVGTVSEITRYWPSRKSTTMEKIVNTESYSGPFWYVGPVGPIGADGKRPKKIMPRNLALDQHPGFIIWE